MFCSPDAVNNYTSVSAYLYTDSACTNLVSVRSGQDSACLGTKERFVCPADYAAGPPPPVVSVAVFECCRQIVLITLTVENMERNVNHTDQNRTTKHT